MIRFPSLLAVALALHFTCFLHAGDRSKEKSKPIFALVRETNWPLWTGAEHPTLVVYEDGRAIVRADKELSFWSLKLPPHEVKKASLLIKRLITSDLKATYDLQPDKYTPGTWIFISTGKTSDATKVFGLEKKLKLPASANSHRNIDLERLVKSLSTVMEIKGEEWHPESYRLYLRESRYINDTVSCPQEWLHHPALPHQNGYIIQGKGLASKFLEFRREHGENARISFKGKAYSVSICPAFPNDQLWKKTFDKVKKKGGSIFVPKDL